jgi:hypothetical protein
MAMAKGNQARPPGAVFHIKNRMKRPTVRDERATDREVRIYQEHWW